MKSPVTHSIPIKLAFQGVGSVLVRSAQCNEEVKISFKGLIDSEVNERFSGMDWYEMRELRESKKGLIEPRFVVIE